MRYYTMIAPYQTWVSRKLLLFAGAFDHVLEQISGQPQAVTPGRPVLREEAYTLVVDHHLDRLYRYIRHTFNLYDSSAQDIVQEIFLHLHKKLDKYDPSKPFEPRLFKVAHNVAIDRLRKQTNKMIKEENILPAEEFLYKMSASQDDDIPAELEHTYKNALLKVMMHKLDRRQRELIVLYYFEQKTYQEIGMIIGVQPSSVGTLLARAKKQLKKLVTTDDLLQDALVYDLDEATS